MAEGTLRRAIMVTQASEAKQRRKTRQRARMAPQSPHPRDVLKKAARQAESQKHNLALARIYDEQGISYRREVQLIADRKFKWDFVIRQANSWPPVAIEVQGQIHRKGGHTTGAGITRDCEKADLASCAGYRTLFFTPEMIADGSALRFTLLALGIN